MNCEACKSLLGPSAKFCTACGAQLQARCPACGGLTFAGEVYCGECGASLRQVVAGDAAELAELLLLVGQLDAQLIERELERV